MKALVLRSKELLAVMDVPEPVLSAGQVLVKVGMCGICGSDVRYYYGENPWAKQTLGLEVPSPPNIILGHELTGTVVDVHDGADRHMVGKRVGINTWTTCGRCHWCRSGQENFCLQTRHLGHGQGWGRMDFYPGGMAELCPAFADRVYELPEDIADEQATFLDPLVSALHAVDVGDPRMLDAVVVWGGGPIGLMIAQLARARGAAATFVIDVAESILEVARKLGVDHALHLDLGPTAIAEAVLSRTGGRGADRVFNTVGSNETIAASLALLANTGVLVLMATTDEDIRFPALALTGERSIKTSTNSLFTDPPRAIGLLAAGLVRVEPMVTHRFGLSDGLKAFQVACAKSETGAIKVVIDCQA
jgi:L-iditol 2-dehydrogenase